MQAEAPQVNLAPELALLRSLPPSEAPPSEYHPSKSLLRPRPPHEAFHEPFVAVPLPEHTPRRASPGPCLRCASTSETFVGYLRMSPSGAHFEFLCLRRGLDPTNSEDTPFGIPSKCLASEDFVSEHLQPEPRSALSAFTWHASTRGPTRTTFAVTVTELPAPLASSLLLDPASSH
ncbi:hypothetical protein GUJ93_ZPchr0006g41051 [Zizania palustris]|uniref:Uncharacterized protein n=1 Tax=Zizania palustris TaxID=103762 RepID=A0A8J5S6R2_ZIZPA|nr:hypothetical protein GUJ93_ZPchr0006g41051 [Zizania palustris]